MGGVPLETSSLRQLKLECPLTFLYTYHSLITMAPGLVDSRALGSTALFHGPQENIIKATEVLILRNLQKGEKLYILEL